MTLCRGCVVILFVIECWVVVEENGHGQILQKSHRGFFAGILVLSGGFVAIIMFYFSTAETNKALIYLITLISLHSIMLFATGVALVMINQVSLLSLPCHTVVMYIRLRLVFCSP